MSLKFNVSIPDESTLPTYAAADAGACPSSRPPERLSCGTSTLFHDTTYTIVSRFDSDDYNSSSPSGVSCRYRLRPAEASGALRIDCRRLNVAVSDKKCDETEGAFNITGIQPPGLYCVRLRPVVIALPETILSFRSSIVGSEGGFRCEARSLTSSAAGCGPEALPCRRRHLQRGTYSLLSHNYPGNYGPNLYCRWQLRAIVASDKLEISCSRFDLECSKNCWRDWLAVEGEKPSSSTGCFSYNTPWCRYCGTRPPALNATGRLNVEFVSDHQTSGAGFNCTVTVGPPDSALP